MPDGAIITGASRIPSVVAPLSGMHYRTTAPADPTGKLAMGCATLLMIPPGSYGTASVYNPSVFSTQYISNMALDINVTAVTGGASPTFSFILERQEPDGSWYNILSTLVGPLPPVVFSIDIGNFSVGYGGLNTAQHATFSHTARLRWIYNNNPTSYTFSVSAIGR